MIGNRRAEPSPVGRVAEEDRVGRAGRAECRAVSSARCVVLVAEVASAAREPEGLPFDPRTRAQEMPGAEPVHVVGGDELTVGHVEACRNIPASVARPAAVQGRRQSQGIARSAPTNGYQPTSGTRHIDAVPGTKLQVVGLQLLNTPRSITPPRNRAST